MKINSQFDQIQGLDPLFGLDDNDAKRKDTEEFPIAGVGTRVIDGMTEIPNGRTSILNVLTEKEMKTLELLFDGKADREMFYGRERVHSVHSGYFVDVIA